MSVWASLVELSTWADSIEKNEYTLLVPSDAVLRNKGLDKYQALVPSANRAALNKEIGHHLIPGRISFANLPDTILKNVYGESLIYISSSKRLGEFEITAVERDLKVGRVVRIR
ncbi:MAG: fasciclin domain-containing protein [Sediminibacterium sp.]